MVDTTLSNSSDSDQTVQAVRLRLFPWNNVFADRKVPKITINGNTVTWSNLEQGMGSYIYTFWG
ncbi:hypothetical protein [Escherichia coli]|uniref:hypothetical protein n=1 Tax=Escherichia coli TaxID=562 RepID=UPI0007E90670|nr:hypothetical protein [Escherichia coli]